LQTAIANTVELQPIGRKRPRIFSKRVPSVLTDWQRQDIEDSWAAGRSAYQVSQAHSCSVSLVLELVLREQQKTLRDQREWLKELDIIVRSPLPQSAPLARMRTA
jgi:hypothetical protein